jgi:hypothetical protein
VTLAVTLAPISGLAATLPVHDPLRILIVSDEVNPHGLSANELTQPGELSAALLLPGSGIHIDTVTEIATDDIAQATTLLSVPIDAAAAYDVVIYFAHRIPNGAGGALAQQQFVMALEAFLTAGGGVVSFHHGVYQTAGKESIQDLLGATATGSVTWNTFDGQNVINVAANHFVTTNQVNYTGSVAYADVGRGIPAGTYPVFNNTPDERYLSFEVNPGAGQITQLFGSDYNESGTTHMLGFTHRRPGWAGIVVVYQPGEYQPNAVDDLQGNNFQILANASYFAANQNIVHAPASGTATRSLLAAVILALGAVAWRRRRDLHEA